MAASFVPAVIYLALVFEVPRTDAVQLAKGRRGCGRIPGAGMNPGSLAPGKESFMDGFYLVGCVKDKMHEFGDKHGDGKYSYAIGDVANVSIVHYTDMVASGVQEPMTHEVCFGFCRTVPDMMFFGITNGRDCYCAPYYTQAPGDSSNCDAVCDGNPTIMCGGKTKSSVFEMHSCGDAAENLAAASTNAETERLKLEEQVGFLTDASEKMQAAAASFQGCFGKVGDAAATGHAQDAKEFAGKLEHAAEEGAMHIESMKELEGGAAAFAGADAESEKLTADLQASAAKAKATTEQLQKLNEEATPPSDGNASAKLYYSVMYFVDKEYVDVPSTCGGKPAAEPIVGSYNGCAEACEKAVGKCVGFTYLAGTDGLCFLHSEISSATYYTGCAAEEKTLFLQRSAASDASVTKCVVKFANFDGTTLKPDPSGKCKGCLKEATKANRCFE